MVCELGFEVVFESTETIGIERNHTDGVAICLAVNSAFICKAYSCHSKSHFTALFDLVLAKSLRSLLAFKPKASAPALYSEIPDLAVSRNEKRPALV
jgi:hypothetical protein